MTPSSQSSSALITIVTKRWHLASFLVVGIVYPCCDCRGDCCGAATAPLAFVGYSRHDRDMTLPSVCGGASLAVVRGCGVISRPVMLRGVASHCAITMS